MAIIKKPKRVGKVQIDLTGSGGNSYALLALATNLARQIKKTGGDNLDSKKIQDEMKSGGYENLLVVFDNYFGNYVDLLR